VSSKTVTHIAKSSTTAHTSQAKSNVNLHEVDKDPACELQAPIWQPTQVTAIPSQPNYPTGHNISQIPILSTSQTNPAIQEKLTVGESNDKFEQEANQVADTVMAMSEPSKQGRPDDSDDESEPQQISKPKIEQITPYIQRFLVKDKNEESPIQTKLAIQKKEHPEQEHENLLQTKKSNSSNTAIDSEQEAYINSIRGKGQALADSDRDFFESRFGFNFSRVRVHIDARAANASRHINAQAFTVGRNIFFAKNRYQPGTQSGRKLLAHELTHTIQQTGGSVIPSPAFNNQLKLNNNFNDSKVTSSANSRPFAVSTLAQNKISNLTSVMRRSDVTEQAYDGLLSNDEMVEWIVDFLKNNPDDPQGKVNSRLATLDSAKMLKVLLRVQKRMALEQPLPKTNKEQQQHESKNSDATSEYENPLNDEQSALTSDSQNEIGSTGKNEESGQSETVSAVTNEQQSQSVPKESSIRSLEDEQLTELITNDSSLPEVSAGPEANKENTVDENGLAIDIEQVEMTGEEMITTAMSGAAAGTGAIGTIATSGAGAGGGNASIETGGGEEFQGGTLDEGESEIEQQLADADPERAAADEMEPEDLTLGEPDEQGENSFTSLVQPESDISEVNSIPESDTGNIPADNSSETSNDQIDKMDSEQADFSELYDSSEDSTSVSGLGNDSEILAGAIGTGLGNDVDLNAPDLSGMEQNAALDSIGQNLGGPGPNVGGGGAGSPLPEPKVVAVPDVSSLDPAAALSTAASLPAVQMQQTLGGVGAAVSKSSRDKRSDLATNLPQKERPSGAPKNLHAQQQAGSDTTDAAADKVEQTPEGSDIPTPELKPFVEPPPSPADNIVAPRVNGSEQGEMTERDVARLSNSLGQLPTRDPGLDATTGPAPTVQLSGNADPAKTDTQRNELRSATIATSEQGRRDASEERGENTKVFPDFAPETLVAELPGSGDGAAGASEQSASVAAGSVAENKSDAVSIIVQQQKSAEIQAEVDKAQGNMSSKQAEYSSSVVDEKAKSDEQMAELERQSSDDQAQARTDVQTDVTAKKGEWTKEQDDAVTDAEKKADTEVTEAKLDIKKEKDTADKEASKEIKKGNKEADAERDKAETKAKDAKKEGKEKKSGFFGWLASKAKAFFDKIKSAIKSAFAYARKMIKKAIEAAKKLAMKAIEMARKAIVAAIKLAGKALIAIGDKLLASFPGMRDRFRKYINDKVDKAVNKVNEYAEQLKKDVAKALDALAAGLDKLLGLLEKGLLAAVDGVAAAVDGAIKFAEKVADAVGAFLDLIKDVASSPLKWLSNLGAAVVDGIKNHLWKTFKAAVQEWFNSKLEQVLGLGAMVWDLIKNGGLDLATVGKMAWEGIKAMIPVALITILVEKLVAMIVPAAGAVMVIIEGMQAAWGAVSRIIAAFKAFFDFLLAVKTGAAGPKFAVALAAAAIAVIDFVANWLLLKLAKGAAKIGGKIKGLAKKILGRKKGKLKGRKIKAKSKTKKPLKTNKSKPKKASKAKKPKRSKSKKKQDKKDNKKKEKQKKIRKGLAAIDKAERKYLKEGKIEEPDAKKVALSVKRKHRVFKSIKVVDGGKRWDYIYIASAPKKKMGEKKKFTNAKEKFEKQIKLTDLYVKSDLLKVFDRRDKEFLKSNWNKVKRKVITDSKFSKIYNKPTLKEHDFGRRVHSDQLVPAYEEAARKKGITVGDVNSKISARKPRIHKDGKNFGLALKSLKEQIFNATKYFQTVRKNFVDAFVKILSNKHTRKTEYPGFTKKFRKDFIEDNRSADDKVKNIYSDYKGKIVAYQDIEVDHIKEVVVHWKQIGHNVSRAVRNIWYNDVSNLRVMKGSENSKAGGKISSKHRFSDKDTGPGYSQ